jgi:5-methylcytosine-specific restriction enzyme A
MPSAPPKACLRCGLAVVDGGSYCPEHRSNTNNTTGTPWASHSDYQTTKKQEPWARWYDLAVWRGKNGLRAVVLGKHPICCMCHRSPSTVADHKIPHKGDWSLFTRLDNLWGICRACHDVKTASERAA